VTGCPDSAATDDQPIDPAESQCSSVLRSPGRCQFGSLAVHARDLRTMAQSDRPSGRRAQEEECLGCIPDGLGARGGCAGLCQLKTRNVVLVVSDGLRWQKSTDADPELLNEAHGGIWENQAALRERFWNDDPATRRKLLFPFLREVVGT